MKPKAGVVDYGMGNLHSVAKGLQLAGAQVLVSNDARKLKSTDLLVLPGVGSFGAAIRTLSRNKLLPFIKDWIREDRPYLGICLGFQMLFDQSEESPKVNGFKSMPGRVRKFQAKNLRRPFRQIPHMGWNQVNVVQKAAKRYFKGIPANSYFYFVHSFFADPKNKTDVATRTEYGTPFCSAVSRGKTFACQFHPEKSGDIGIRLLKNILKESIK